MWAAGVERSERTVTATATRCDAKDKDKEVRSCPTWPYHVFCPLDFTYIFASMIDADALEKSLATVLGAYPVLAGRYIERGARVGCHNQGVPLTVATLSATGQDHSIHDVPADPPKGSFTDIRDLENVADGKEAILTVALTLFDDGCVLGVTINHGCSDGRSFATFMQDWSDCHNGKQIAPVLMGLPAKAQRVLSEEEVEKYPKFKMPRVKDLLEEYYADSPEKPMRAAKATSALSPGGRQRLHFSDKALKRLKHEAEVAAGTWVSTNEALLAHVYVRLLQAAGVQNRERCGIEVSVDLRGRLGAIPRRMLGRAVVNIELLTDLSDPVKAGAHVHNAMREELEEKSLMLRHEATVYAFEKHIALRLPSPETTHKLAWNFQGKMAFYQIDFGGGTPVRGIPWNANEEVKVVPCAQGGLDVFISDSAKLHGWSECDFVGQVVAENH